MLKIKPSCEHCDKALPNESDEAMICSYECTFCTDCVTHVLENVCPNCGGGFEKRPTRPNAQLEKHPASNKRTYQPVKHNPFLAVNMSIPPRNR